MAKIKAVEVGEQVIYMQVDESEVDNTQPVVTNVNNTVDDDFETKGDSPSSLADNVVNNLKGLIHTMTKTTVDAIRDGASANVNKVTLEFGVTLGTNAGFFIANGKAEGAIKVSVELTFPDKTEKKSV